MNNGDSHHRHIITFGTLLPLVVAAFPVDCKNLIKLRFRPWQMLTTWVRVATSMQYSSYFVDENNELEDSILDPDNDVTAVHLTKAP